MTRRHITTTALALLLGAPLAGCEFDEGLLIHNLKGTVRLPEEAATRTLVLDDGGTETITDPRLIGPVYIGLFPNVLPADVVEKYPHPEVGPQFTEGVPGDTYPYGGTTIGDIRFACFEFLTCKMVSGRYVDFDDIIDWFQTIETPVVDAAGAEIESGEFFRQTCYDILNSTTDAEVQITATEDRNEDGEISAADLDFVQDSDGSFVAEFTIWQQEMFWDKNQEREGGCTPGEDCTGFQVWAFMDAPSPLSFKFSTCDQTQGFQNQEYNADFFGGRAFADVLNQPAKYISIGDWISSPSEEYVWSDPFYQPEIMLDFEVQ
jgi:hypothetical protein